MTEKKPVDKPPPSETAKLREAAKETLRAKALKANLRRRKAPSGPEQDAS